MEKRDFIKKLFVTSAFLTFNPVDIFNILTEEVKIILPFIDGEKEITILNMSQFSQNAVNAQYGRYYNSYNYLASYRAFYAYQQAQIYWRQAYNQWLAQRYYQWLREQHYREMQQLLHYYRNYYQIGQPSVMDSIQSIYAYARNNYGQRTLFGINKNCEDVAIFDTVNGAERVYQNTNDAYGQQEAEKIVGPQSREIKAYITLPDSSQLKGKVYSTHNGFFAVSNPNQLVKSNDGKIGRLAKYTTGPDGEQYAVV